MSVIRTAARGVLSAMLARRARSALHEAPPDCTIVFSPHPDDETLGCGGVIAQRRRLGTDVRIVFLTDGSRSHGLVPARELAALRAAEAVAAAGILGVAREHVELLGFPDGRLQEHASEAIDPIASRLRELRPGDVFVPTKWEAPADHRAAREIVLAALRRADHRCTVWEYPVWFWRHWPWTGWGRGRERIEILRDSLRARLGVRLLREFRAVVAIDDVLAQKRAALAQHATQTTRIGGDPRWDVLADVADGELLACFFQGFEIFHCYPSDLPGAAHGR